MRPPKIQRPIPLHTALPEDLKVKLDLFLWSAVEQRIPLGAYQRFFIERINEFFNSEALDLSLYTQVQGNAQVRGSPETIQLLKQILGGAV